MIISLLVTGQPKKITIISLLVTFPPKLVTCYCPLKKNIDYFVSRYCPLKKVTIKSLVAILSYKKVSIIRYSLLFHVKSNDKFVNHYFSHTKYFSLTLIVTNPHTKYNVEQSVGWPKERNID